MQPCLQCVITACNYTNNTNLYSSLPSKTFSYFEMEFSIVDNFDRILLVEAGVFLVCNQDTAMTFGNFADRGSFGSFTIPYR